MGERERRIGEGEGEGGGPLITFVCCTFYVRQPHNLFPALCKFLVFFPFLRSLSVCLCLSVCLSLCLCLCLSGWLSLLLFRKLLSLLQLSRNIR